MFTMTFYMQTNPDGSIHIQNAVGSMFGQHHVHDEVGLAKWKEGAPEKGIGPVNPNDIVWLTDVSPCDCGLAIGEMRSGL
jgi:hypothetical protein